VQQRNVDAVEAAVGSVRREAGEVREALVRDVVADAEIPVRLVKVAGAGRDIGEAMSLEPAARHDVEDAVAAVAVVRRKTAAVDLERVDVLRIELRSDGREVAF